MRCPACENQLTKYKVSKLTVDICRGSCGGIWIHHSQIKKIQHLKPGVGTELLLLEKADGLKTYRNTEHPCPNCKTTLLYRHFFSQKYDTEVNQCSKCGGFWIDAGGLTEILKSSKKDKKDLIENYYTVIMKEKISGMNRDHPDIETAAKMITTIFNFIRPE